MGWTYEVQAYKPMEDTSPTMYTWVTTWTGNGRIAALYNLYKAKKKVGAVQLIWRS